MRKAQFLNAGPALGLALALVTGLTLAGCTGTERIATHFANLQCTLNGGYPISTGCVETPFAPVEPPRFCYQTLARIDCYAEPVRFGPDIGFQRAAPPDLVN